MDWTRGGRCSFCIFCLDRWHSHYVIVCNETNKQTNRNLRRVVSQPWSQRHPRIKIINKIKQNKKHTWLRTRSLTHFILLLSFQSPLKQQTFSFYHYFQGWETKLPAWLELLVFISSAISTHFQVFSELRVWVFHLNINNKSAQPLLLSLEAPPRHGKSVQPPHKAVPLYQTYFLHTCSYCVLCGVLLTIARQKAGGAHL